MVNRKRQFGSLMQEKSFRRRAFYFLIFFLACMTVYDVTNLTMEYLENPKQANMNMIFNDSMTYPNMTFCMSKRQAWSHFGVNPGDKAKIDKIDQWTPEVEKALANFTDRDAFMREMWPDPLVMSGYEAIATLNSLEREDVAQQAMLDIKAFGKSPKQKKLRHLINKWLEAIEARNITFGQFTSKVGLETLRRSVRAMQRLSYDDEDDEPQANIKPKISWLSSKQLCFQPIFLDEKSFRPIGDQGKFFLLTLVHDNTTLGPNDANAECMSVDFHGRPTTVARNMEGKGRVKDGTTESLCIGKVHEVIVDIRAHYTMLENDDKATACRNYDDVDDAEVNEFECRSRCRMEMIRQMCHCTPMTLGYLSDDSDLERYPYCDYEKCEIPKNLNFTDQLCAGHCLPHCVQIRYNIQPELKGRGLNPQLTRITLKWGAFEYLDLCQQYVWSLWTFIAAVGGSIGLWLGLSVLSLIQLITFLTERTAGKVKEKKHHRKDRVGGAGGGGGGGGGAGIQNGPRKASQTESEKERERKLSLNPFGGPVAVNPFESPFAKPKEDGTTGGGGGVAQPQQQLQQPHANNYTSGPKAGVNETAFRAASP